MRLNLIGKPAIIMDDGTLVRVPGHQPWAVLARLVLADRPLARRQIAGELFSDADDPLGALRWCLAALRKALGPRTLRGDPIDLNLPEGTVVDVRSIDRAGFDLDEPAEFLQGVEPSSGAEFSTWLLVAREQIAGRLHQHLRRAAVEALARGNADLAMHQAERAIRLSPLDESGHILLVKALAMAGKSDAALAHIGATEAQFEAAVGERPSRALRLAARKTVGDPPKGISETAIIDSLVKSGTAAVSAGAVDAGLDCLRQASAKAEAIGDHYLIARTFLELGSALVHAIRGFDDEGSIMLRHAADIAVEAGCSGIAAAALRELGYVEALAGRRPAADIHLKHAFDHADNDDDALAGIHAMMGFNFVDWGQHHLGLSHFEKAIDRARSCGNQRREIWALGIGGWGQLRAGRADIAEDWLTRCTAMCDDMRWLAFRPWPQALLVEARLRQGRVENSAAATLDASLALSVQLGDPCWEAATARAKALLHEDRGELGDASDWLVHARSRLCSVTDLYAALLIEILSDELRLFRKRRKTDEASLTARELVVLAARTHADAYLEDAVTLLHGPN
ncbi:BTAD domain-containing putative transcriptional regulator [Frigidibacter sp. RF13]|uniref:BTAD domain-containing putative transcriptional regulator n=1 Tax=Frigidibacter sp. RF13 TaxID=2997340 RepID=UPI00226DBA5B|nr:BTAD domain-containing putative transcriptional regulator [Frigidibacter sp. RF13]MCY1126174.1 BTAD domain-containing putative transcriptional regulator [Frigidibacter sp. RF13]